MTTPNSTKTPTKKQLEAARLEAEQLISHHRREAEAKKAEAKKFEEKFTSYVNNKTIALKLQSIGNIINKYAITPATIVTGLAAITLGVMHFTPFSLPLLAVGIPAAVTLGSMIASAALFGTAHFKKPAFDEGFEKIQAAQAATKIQSEYRGNAAAKEFKKQKAATQSQRKRRPLARPKAPAEAEAAQDVHGNCTPFGF